MSQNLEHIFWSVVSREVTVEGSINGNERFQNDRTRQGVKGVTRIGVGPYDVYPKYQVSIF